MRATRITQKPALPAGFFFGAVNALATDFAN